MPTYEYICIECQEKAEIRATISEKERGLKVTCPRCGSNKMVQVFGSFAVTGSSKGRFNPSFMPSCGPTAGPRCCPSN
ncbi:MAG: FmdB family zinc ribbon protein [Dehalococcoidales bacterium]